MALKHKLSQLEREELAHIMQHEPVAPGNIFSYDAAKSLEQKGLILRNARIRKWFANWDQILTGNFQTSNA